MALKIYVKQYPSVKKQVAHTVSYISLITGSLLLFWSFYPIISFQLYTSLFIQGNTLSPLPSSDAVSSLQEANAVLGENTVFSNNLRDLVQANLWFPSKPQNETNNVVVSTKSPDHVVVEEYSLSIPKLNISNAKVKVGGDDLSKNLVHYLPTSLPGENGNVAIFGHSTLPQLYNVKDYKTIFTYLPSLEKGDTVLVKVLNETYEYQVFDMFVVKPEQVSVLEQKFDAPYLTLITCVPPGTFWNRLVVRAKMIRKVD